MSLKAIVPGSSGGGTAATTTFDDTGLSYFLGDDVQAAIAAGDAALSSVPYVFGLRRNAFGMVKMAGGNSYTAEGFFQSTSNGSGTSVISLVSNSTVLDGVFGAIEAMTGSTNAGAAVRGSRSSVFSPIQANKRLYVGTVFKLSTLPVSGGDDYVYVGPAITTETTYTNNATSNAAFAGLILTSGAVNFQLGKRVSSSTTYTDTGIIAAAGTWYASFIEVVGNAAAASVVVNLYLGTLGSNPSLVATTTGVENSTAWASVNDWIKKTNGSNSVSAYLSVQSIACVL